MHDLMNWQHQLLSILEPGEPIGAFIYFVLFFALALMLSRGLRAAVHAALSKERHVDRTAISFMQQIGTVVIWIIMIILYAHLIPQLRALGTALLAGAGVASVVIGLVAAPTGTEIGVVDHISLGYTTLRVQDGRFVVLPNSVAASQVAINLSPNTGRWPLSIAIRLNRDADLEAASALARKAAAEVVGEAAVTGC